MVLWRRKGSVRICFQGQESGFDGQNEIGLGHWLPHSTYRLGTTLRQGDSGLRANVEVDDFQASWGSFETVTDDPDYRGYAGNMHYVQYLVRDHPLNMRPGQQYKLVLSYQPDVAFADE